MVVLKYQFIDNYLSQLDPYTVYGKNKDTDEKINYIKELFTNNGWEGDGNIKLIWIPPFLDQAGDMYNGDYIWHVKQKNDGISFLAFDEDNIIQSARLLEQNPIIKKGENEIIEPLPIIKDEELYLNEKIAEHRKVLEDITRLFTKEMDFKDLHKNSLGYLQNDIVASFLYFVDEIYLKFLIEVLSHNNPDSIKLQTSKVTLDLTSISELSSEINLGDDHWLTIQKIISNIWRDFKFKPIKEKIQNIINCIGFDGGKDEIQEIYKHIAIRNCIQHHGGFLDAETIRLYGYEQINVLSVNGKKKKIKIGQKIDLYEKEILFLLDIISTFNSKYSSFVKDRLKSRIFQHRTL